MQPSDKILFKKALAEHRTQVALAAYLDVNKSLVSYWKVNGFTKPWRLYFLERYGKPAPVKPTLNSTRRAKSRK